MPPMDALRWKRVEELYHAALGHPVEDRDVFVEKACGGDDGLRAEVESLLAQNGISGGPIDRPAWDAEALIDGEADPQLAPGAKLGPYEIDGLLGSGGMGKVYRARDTRLTRSVAIKIAHERFSGRFEREARSISALNHPNVCTLYDVGPNYLVLELLEGETLAERLRRGALPVKTTLQFALQIADALVSAHALGIIHRDLKPGNVMITKSGVKVLDFGLAKSPMDATLTGSQTLMGTPAYMAPEQRQGAPSNERTDIFAFGLMLCEMFTGKSLTAGQQIPESVPQECRAVVAKCIAPDPGERWQSVKDLKAVLEWVGNSEPSREDRAKTPLRAVGWIAAGVFALLAIAALVWMSRMQPERPAVQGSVLTRLTSDSGLTTDPAISPGGDLFAYASDRSGEGTLDIWVQQVAGGAPIRRTTNPADDHEPSFSPDGSQIAFRSERDSGGVYVVPTLGGTERRVADFGVRPRFSPDGKWIAYFVGGRVAWRDAIYIIPANGGQPRRICEDFRSAAYPVWSPDSTHILFLGFASGSPFLDWWVTPIEGGNAVRVPARAATQKIKITGDLIPFEWLSDNRILFTAAVGDANNVWTLPITTDGRVAGRPERLTFGANVEGAPSIWKNELLFVTQNKRSDLWVLRADGNAGRAMGEPKHLTDEASVNAYPSLSADGRMLAYLSHRVGSSDVWTKNLDNGAETRLSFGADIVFSPWMSTDGSSVAFAARKGQNIEVLIAPTNGGVLRKVCENCGRLWSWMPEGKGLIFGADSGGPRPATVLDLTTHRTKDLIRYDKSAFSATITRDGRWVLFQTQNSLETRQIFVAEIHDGTVIARSEWIAITDGTGLDRNPFWSPDENLVYFQSERDGFRCLYARALDPRSKRPVDSPFAVYHAHRTRLSLSNLDDPAAVGPAIARDKIIFSLGEHTGNIWMARPIR